MTSKWPVQGLAQFMAEDYPVEEDLIEPSLLIRGGKMQLYGKAKVGKSYLILQLALCLSGGRDWLGYRVPRPARTLYVQCEIVPGQLQRRLRGLTSEFPTGVDMMHVSNVYDRVLAKRDDFDDLASVITAAGVEVVIIDPLYLFMLGSEIAGEDTATFIRGLNYVNAATNAAIIIVHHSRKMVAQADGAVRPGMDSSKGSTNLVQWPDTIASLAKVGEGKVELRWEGVRHGKEPPPRMLRFDDLAGRFEVLTNEPHGFIIEALQDGPVSVPDLDGAIEAATGLSNSQVRRIRRQMREEGFVVEYKDKDDERKRWVARS